MAEKETKGNGNAAGTLPIKTRLLKYLKKQHMTMAQLEREAGLANAYLRNSNGAIGGEKLRDIKFALPDLNLNWLLTGQGKMEECKDGKEAKVNQQTGPNARGAFDRGQFNENHLNLYESDHDDDVIYDNIEEINIDDAPKKYRKVLMDFKELKGQEEELTAKIAALEQQVEALTKSVSEERDKVEAGLRENSQLKDELIVLWREKAQK